MNDLALRPRDLAWLAALSLAAVLAFALGLGVRAPAGAHLGLELTVSGPRLLMAAAVGMGLAVSGALAPRGARPAARETLVLGVSFGGAAGGTGALAWLAGGALGPAADFALGALAGALGSALLLFGLRRVPAVGGLLAGLTMLAMLGAAVVAGVAAKGDPTGFRAVTWWMLGDFSRASWPASLAVLALIVGLAALAWRRAHSPSGAATLGALSWGVAVGAGGVIAWFGALVALAVRRFARPDGRRALLALSAATGALAMIAADALPRLLVGGYAPPVGVAVAMLAIPWYFVWGEGRPAGSGARALRALDVLLALASAGMLAAAAGFLTLIVSIAG